MQSIIKVNQDLPFIQKLPLSLQHVFAMFGSTILVPMLFHIDPALCLLCNGFGTLLYLFITRNRIPAYLGSSFAFIAPVMLVISKYGYSAALSGFWVSGILLIILAGAIQKFGVNWIERILPGPSIGAIVIVIGLELAPVAAKMANLIGPTYDKNTLIGTITLIATMVYSLFFRGFIRVIAVLLGIITGYIGAIFAGLISWDMLHSAAWVSLPHWYGLKFNINAIATIIPAVLVIFAEHIGHLYVTGNIINDNLVKRPWMNLSLFSNGASTCVSALMGATPNTTYGENIGVLAMTRVYSTHVIRLTAIIAIILAFCGKLSALIMSIPACVIGGVSMLLFGVIAVSGIRMLVEKKTDFNNTHNLTVAAIILVIGVSGVSLQIETLQLKGMGLATVFAVVINLAINIFMKNSSLDKTKTN
ncbi:MAG: uracil permease [Neisseriales bacterium]|nr:MAG: uracil permease [Neisseriales bacterium]